MATPAAPSHANTPIPVHPVEAAAGLYERVRHADWSGLGAEWGLRIVGGLVLLGVGIWIARRLSRVASGVLARFGVDGILTSFLSNIVRVLGLVVVFIATLQFVGLPTTSLLAVLGAAGLGIGLALKDSLSNISSGVMLILLRPFRAGDEVQVAGLNGIVEQVRIFQTVLRAFDNRVIILPNSLITTAPITNLTARDRRRIDLTIGIGYDDDIRTARDALTGAARANRHVLAEPAPEVLVSALAESTINVVLRAWVATRDYNATKSELMEASRVVLGARGVSIPFPQRDLHVFHHGVDDPRDGERMLAEAAARSTKPRPSIRSLDEAPGPTAPSVPMPQTPES